MNCEDVNANTVGKPTTLEGLETTRGYVSGQRMLGSVVDEASGYYNHKLLNNFHNFTVRVLMELLDKLTIINHNLLVIFP